MQRATNGRTVLVLCLAAASAPATAAASPLAVSGDVTATTDYIFRGVSQTMSGPALQGSLGVAHDSGFTASAWASNVDYVAEGRPDDGARLEVDLVVGWERALGERLATSVGRSEYLIPGVDPGIDYDYGEWWAGLELDERHHVTAFHSDSVSGSGKPGWYVVAGTGIDLFAGLALDLAVGHGDLCRALGGSYSHVDLALSGALEAFGWRLAFHAASDAAGKMFYAPTVEPRVVLSVTWTVWE